MKSIITWWRLTISGMTGLQAKDETMKRYLIERDIPGVGNLSAELLKGVAAKSNGVLARLAPKIQWLEIVRRRQQDVLRLSC